MSRRRTPGLTKRGETWHIDKQIKGYGRIRESCGTNNLKEAERYLVHRLEEIRLAEVYGVRPTRTFEQAAIKYLEDYQYKRSIERDIIALNIVMPYIGSLPLDRVHNDSLATFKQDRRRVGRKAGTINKELGVVRRILNLAARVWRHPNGQTWLPSSPLLEMERGPARRPYPISWEEQGRLLRELPAHLERIALFGLNTGCRSGEICRLSWDWEVAVPEVNDSVFIIPDTVAAEAWRIEDKFSRYVSGNIVDDINSSDGHEIEVDDETANLLDFADSLYRMSDGRFDISSGALRNVWNFDGSDRVPSQVEIDAVLQVIGWDKVRWKKPVLKLRPGMEIDLGGIGKEYAVDRAAALVRQLTDAGSLINFGGDLAVVGEPAAGGWRVGIESVDPDVNQPDRLIRLRSGALATSGDARRFVLKDGIRYGHVLNPMTGWPIDNAARSITVAADTCTQAGMMATLAMVRGADAEEFLDQQAVKYWCLR